MDILLQASSAEARFRRRVKAAPSLEVALEEILDFESQQGQQGEEEKAEHDTSTCQSFVISDGEEDHSLEEDARPRKCPRKSFLEAFPETESSFKAQGTVIEGEAQVSGEPCNSDKRSDTATERE